MRCAVFDSVAYGLGGSKVYRKKIQIISARRESRPERSVLALQPAEMGRNIE